LSLVIRTFRVEDLERVNEVEAISFRAPWPRSFFKYMHGKAPDLFLVAAEGGELVGYVVGEMREIMFSGVPHRFRVGHILNIAVESRHRRGGVGARLMKGIEGRFVEENATRITLEVRESNTAARSFYQLQGFVEIGRVRAYYPDEDAVIMSKTLQAG